MNVLITGGASGLGEAITKKIASNAHTKVYFTFSNSSANAFNIESQFSNAIGIKCDFRNEDEVKELVDKIASLDLDVLINNAYAGYFLKDHFHKTAPNEFLSEFKENILPTIHITQSAISAFRKKKSGKIITILTSALLNTPPIGASIYLANKAYLQQLVKVWATENVKFNITSNSISPSFMSTNITKDIDSRIVEQMRESHPLKSFLTTDEVADTVDYLINCSSHVNGTDIVMNAAYNIK